MIAICTKCQAKFRVADEKIGPRGAKVRCSRCRTIFLVQHEAGTDRVEHGMESAAPPSPAPGAAFDLEPARAQQPDDPFALARHDPFGGKDPFAAPEERSRSSLPVTDLSDLLGPETPPAAARPSAVPPPLPSWVAGAGRPAPLSALLPPEPSDGLGLALEDRLTPPPMKVARLPDAEPPLDLGGPAFGQAPAFEAALGASRDPFAAAAVPYDDAGPYEHAPGPIDAPAHGDHAPAEPASQVSEVPGPVAAAAARSASRTADELRPRPRSSRLRTVAVNAIALAALLLVALAILGLWRTEGPIDARSLRPAALLAALRGGDARPDPFGAREVRSGLYERQRGAPLLFVRGEIVSRAPAPVAAVKVSVEVVRAGQVVARGEAIAGAVPTPEELYSAADDAALVRTAQAARQRAPASVKPGDAVPFLVAIADAPPDLEGAAIRLDVAAAAGGAR